MSDFIKTAAGKLLLTVAGAIVTLTWWSWSGDGGDYETVRTMPQQVLGGGGGTIELKYEVNQPAQLAASFEQWDEQAEDSTGLYVEQPIPAGSHARSVEVPEDAYVYFELQIPDPQPGAKIDWQVLYEGRSVYSEDLELDEPLEDGYAFFVQFEADSVGEIRQWQRR